MSSPATEPLPQPTQRSARLTARRDELLDVAWAVVERRGEQTVMGDIADAAGVTRAILYRHLGGVEDLYLALGERFADRLLARYADLGNHAGRGLLAAVVDGFIGAVEAHPGVYRYLTRRITDAPDGSDATVRTFIHGLAETVRQYLHGQGAPPVVADLWARVLVAAVQAAGEFALDHAGATTAEVVDLTVDLLWSGLDR